MWTLVAIVGIGLQVVLVVGVAYVAVLLRRDASAARAFRSTMLRRSARIVDQGARSRNRDERLREFVQAEGRRAGLAQAARQLDLQRQAQAWANLQGLVRLDAAVPGAGGWAASPDLLLYCVDQLLDRRPELVVECGSGVTTLMLALAAEQHGLPTRIVALEHQQVYADKTRRLLERHGVADRVDIRVAPLVPSSVAGHATPWYDENALAGLDGIGMLLVDGPPTGTGPLARYPAVPLLRDRLGERCLIVMDDMVRDADQETAARWVPLLDGFDYTLDEGYEKHLGIFERG